MRGTLSRRRLLRSAATVGLGATALALVGCSSDDDPEPDDAPQQQQQQSQQQDQPSAAQQQQQQEPAAAQAEQPGAQQEQAAQQAPPLRPTAGGVMRSYLPIDRFDTWDPHRSRYRYAQNIHSLVYSRILQPADPHTGELQADLCGLPEMPDQSTYVFTLDPRATFWDQPPTDGRPVGVDDIRLNIERQQSGVDANGAPDVYLFRRRDWNRAAFAPGDDGTFTLSANELDAPFLGSVVASPFAWMISSEAIDAAAGWRVDPFDHTLVSGSGPYVPSAYDPSVELKLSRSQNWWRSSGALPDGITLAGGPPEDIIRAYFSSEFDRADFPLSNDTVEALREQEPEHTRFDLPLDAPVQLLAPIAPDPLAALGDPRVVSAISASVDRRRLIDRLYQGHGRVSGPLPWYLEGWALADDQLANYPGYRAAPADDRAEAAQLIAAAGGVDAIAAVPFVVADLFEGFFPGAGPFVQSMVQDATGLTLELEFRPFAEALSQLQQGERFLFLAWGEAPHGPDPTDRWHESLHSAGEQNWGDVADSGLDDLIERMRRTFDLDARRDLSRQVQQLLLGGEAAAWAYNLANGIQLGVSQPWLHLDPRALAYAWSTQHLATSWLDTSESSAYPADLRTPPDPEDSASE